MTRVAILNSRQSKTPVGGDPWVRSTQAACEYAAGQEWIVVSSVGMNTWELATWATARCGGTLELVLPAQGDRELGEYRETVTGDFGIASERIRWHTLPGMPYGRGGKSWWGPRDRCVTERADVLLPISVRPGGQLAQLIEEKRDGQTVDRRFAVPYEPVAHHLRDPVDFARLSEAVRNWEGNFVIHWTRACHGPWPGETRAQFYADAVGSGDRYCRSGLDTLKQIVTEQKIRASAWRIAGARPMVALTALTPVESIPLMRWRSRWARWSFEPYGIAISRRWAREQGLKPVKYVTESEWKSLTGSEKPFCHRVGRNAGAWPAEREWRLEGNLELSSIPSALMRVIVRDHGETSIIRDLTEAAVVSFH